ncbi:MAG: hypothetical protein ABIU86_08665, partial [Gemmatimonadaceae bacterium]
MKFHRATAVCAAAIALSCARAAGTRPGSVQGDSRDIVIVSTTDVHGHIRAWDYYADSAEASR